MNSAIRFPSPHRPVILIALNWYSLAIHRGIARYASEAGWILDSSMTRHGLVPKDWRGDGIISCVHWGSDLHEMVRRTTLPVVNIGGSILDRPPSFPTTRRSANSPRAISRSADFKTTHSFSSPTP